MIRRGINIIKPMTIKHIMVDTKINIAKNNAIGTTKNAKMTGAITISQVSEITPDNFKIANPAVEINDN